MGVGSRERLAQQKFYLHYVRKSLLSRASRLSVHAASSDLVADFALACRNAFSHNRPHSKTLSAMAINKACMSCKALAQDVCRVGIWEGGGGGGGCLIKNSVCSS